MWITSSKPQRPFCPCWPKQAQETFWGNTTNRLKDCTNSSSNSKSSKFWSSSTNSSTSSSQSLTIQSRFATLWARITLTFWEFVMKECILIISWMELRKSSLKMLNLLRLAFHLLADGVVRLKLSMFRRLVYCKATWIKRISYFPALYTKIRSFISWRSFKFMIA